MDSVRSAMSDIKKMPIRNLLLQAVNLGTIIASALIIWRFLIIATGSKSPIVVVLSGSMEPGYYRGDILFLNQPKAALNPGDIVVFDTGVRDVPIVHRIIKLHQQTGNTSSIDILTKGDNNWGDDRSLYPPGMRWLHKEHIMGRVVGSVPVIGRLTIVMNDYPLVKVLLILGLGVFVLTSKE